jgi:hypothetical protein
MGRMRLRWAAPVVIAAMLVAMTVVLGGCGGNNTVLNPTPIITGLFPDSATAAEVGNPACVNGPVLNVNIAGTNFITTSQAQFNGANRTTSLNVTTSQLTVSLLACDTDMPGTGQITVTNPLPGGGISGALTFTINPPNNQVPTITSLDPSNTNAGGPAFCVTVNGTNFLSNSTVAWNGSPRSATMMCSGMSSTDLVVQINPADIATAGSASVTVTNPAPGGGTSAPFTFTIN